MFHVGECVRERVCVCVFVLKSPVLRMISYSIDYVRSVKVNGEKYKERNKKYGILYMVSYCVYSPLYIAGPIICFDDYISCLMKPQRTESITLYGVRWLLAFLLMEFLCIRFPVFATFKSGLFRSLTPYEIAALCYISLKMM